MRYDGARAKWLSVESTTFQFGRSANTAAGSYYQNAGGTAYNGAEGLVAFFNGTVIGLAYTRTDTDSATFGVTDDGTTIASLASTALAGKDITLNADFAVDSVLGVRNETGGNTVSNGQGWVRVKWRA